MCLMNRYFPHLTTCCRDACPKDNLSRGRFEKERVTLWIDHLNRKKCTSTAHTPKQQLDPGYGMINQTDMQGIYSEKTT